MTSGYAPPSIPSAQIGTPPREWSESILASSPTGDTPATFPEIPGRADNSSRTAEKSRDESQVLKELEKQQAQPSSESKSTTTKNQPTIGATVVHAAKQYVPEQVTATAVSYLPDPQGIKGTVSSHLASEKHEGGVHVSLPSTELRGAQPSEHTGGVGALPGNLSESSVALLPDERQERSQESRPTSSRQRRDTIKPSAEGGDNEEAKLPRDVALSTDEPVASVLSDVPTKSAETRAAETAESNIAVKSGPKQEPLKERGETGGWGAAATAATGMVGTAPTVEEPGERIYNLASEELSQAMGLSQDVQEGGNEEGKTTTAERVEAIYGGEDRTAQLPTPPPEASVAEYQTSLSTQQGQDLPTRTTGKRSSMSAEKKPGFMTMIKGEMKILAGKMSGDEQKIEEGKKIVQGEA